MSFIQMIRMFFTSFTNLFTQVDNYMLAGVAISEVARDKATAFQLREELANADDHDELREQIAKRKEARNKPTPPVTPVDSTTEPTPNPID